MNPFCCFGPVGHLIEDVFDVARQHRKNSAAKIWQIEVCGRADEKLKKAPRGVFVGRRADRLHRRLGASCGAENANAVDKVGGNSDPILFYDVQFSVKRNEANLPVGFRQDSR